MKKILISFLVTILFISTFSVVNAGSVSVDLTPSVTTVKPGDTFTVDVVANAGYDVTAIESELTYDKSDLVLKDKEEFNGFTDISASGKELNACLFSLEGVTLSKSVKIFTLEFQVLANATEGNTEISLSNVGLSLVNESKEQIDVNATGDSITIEIKKEEEQQPEDKTPPVGTITYKTNDDGSVTATITFGGEQGVIITNNEGKNTYVFTKTGEFTFEFQDAAGNKGTAKAETTVQSKEDPKEDDTTAGGKDDDKTDDELPQTGIEDISFVVVIAMAVSIISYVFVKRYKDIK